MPPRTYTAQVFYQYGDDDASHSGKLISFSAPAREIVEWAGVPRKGWTLRALYQRILDERRLKRVAGYFTPRAAGAGNLSPTAITIALTAPALVTPDTPGTFELTLTSPVPADLQKPTEELARLARVQFELQKGRLESSQAEALDKLSEHKLDRSQFDALIASDDYVAAFLADMVELATDPEQFLKQRDLRDPLPLLDALFELSKPALIVDGQHRIFGAKEATGPRVSFLVCAMPQTSWMEQAFQFVVINEEARPVDATILYDIFGSSLTRGESDEVRRRLGPAGRDVEKRIAAVIASRDQASPFANMVQLNVADLPRGIEPYLSPRLIVDLIEGTRGCRGFRADSDFYEWVVKPSQEPGTDQADWSSWGDGRWRAYWYALWAAVRDYFNSGQPTGLWNDKEQSNLTLGVTLKALQDVILGEMLTRARSVSEQAEELKQLDVEEEKIHTFLAKHYLPESPELFGERVRSEYLEGFPRAFFERDWSKSLDTAAGIEALRTVLQETWASYVGKGGNRRYPYWRNQVVFSAKKPDVKSDADESESAE